MKLLHLGDLHLGKTLGEYDLIEDQRYILEQILKIIGDNSADAVLMSGDIYDRSIPSEAATRLLDWFLSSLSEAGVKTFLISGNHDSDDRLNFGSSLFETNQIYISSIYDGTLYERVLTDEYGEIHIYLLPFVKASQVRHYFPKEKIESYDDAVRVIIEHADIDPSKRNILAAHQFVAGKGKDPKLVGSEGVSVQSVGLVEKIGYDHFEAFDYVALGHIHSPQSVGRKNIRYSGSILKYSLSESSDRKSAPLITLGEKGETDIDLIPLEPLRDLRHITGPAQKLLAGENIESPEDYIYVTLTDEDILYDAMQIFRQVYPNTVKIDYDNSHTKEIEQVDLTKIGNHRSFSELIGDFYRQMYDREITEEEMTIMRQAAKEAGVIDEAD